jgi:hypothetical protein
MSLAHLNAALKADKLKVKGGALQLLWLICFRAGNGHPSNRSGKVIPLGQWRVTDKTIMRMMHVKRRKSLYEWRQRLRKLGVLDWDVKWYPGQPEGTWAIHLYTVKLEMLQALSKHRPSNAKGIPKEMGRKPLQSDGRKPLQSSGVNVAENATLIGTTSLTGAKPAPLTSLPEAGSSSVEVCGKPPNQNQIQTGGDSQEGTTHTTGYVPQACKERWEDSCMLAESLIKLFPAWTVDIEDLYILAGSYAAEEVYEVIQWLPVSSNPSLFEAASSTRFRLWFKTIRAQYEKYQQAVADSGTEQNYQTWAAIKTAMRQDAACLEKFKAYDPPIDPGDAAEEEAVYRAEGLIDDGVAVELDPQQDPFGDVPDEQFEDSVPECIDHPHYGSWKLVGSLLFKQCEARRAATGETNFVGSIDRKPNELQYDRYHDGQKICYRWIIREIYNEVTQ